MPRPRKSGEPLPREIIFVTDVPIYIVAEYACERGGHHWRIKQVVVDDENVNLDPKHVHAQDANGNELPKDNLAVMPALSAVNEAEWPAWEFGW